MDNQLLSNLERLEKLFQSRMGEYDGKLQNVAAGTGTSNPDISNLISEFTTFKAFVWESLSAIKTQIELLSLGLDRHENAMRRKILLLHGVPDKQNENAFVVVHKVITDQLKLPDISLDHLQVCHRLGGAQGKVRPILVRFVDMEHRKLVWDNKSSLKGTGITVSEFLTKSRHNVLVSARNHFGIKQCWSVEGKIIIVLPDKSRKKIEVMSELIPLISKFPISTEGEADTQTSTSTSAHTSKPNAKAPKSRSRR